MPAGALCLAQPPSFRSQGKKAPPARKRERHLLGTPWKATSPSPGMDPDTGAALACREAKGARGSWQRGDIGDQQAAILGGFTKGVLRESCRKAQGTGCCDCAPFPGLPRGGVTHGILPLRPPQAPVPRRGQERAKPGVTVGDVTTGNVTASLPATRGHHPTPGPRRLSLARLLFGKETKINGKTKCH